MKFSIGDIVLLKHTGAEGRVVGYVNNEMVEVEAEGTHFPVFIDEVEHPYLKRFQEKKPATIRKSEPLPVEQELPRLKTASGFHLSFLPVFRLDAFEDLVERLKIYFINQTRYELTLQYECHVKSGLLFRHQATVSSFSHFYLHDIPFEQMNEHPRFSYIIIGESPPASGNRLESSLSIKPKKLFSYINKSQEENNPMFSLLLAEDFPRQHFPAEGQQRVPFRKPVSSGFRGQKAPVPVIDLHREQLETDTRGWRNFEILVLQLNILEQALDTAMHAQQRSMVVIHGVGNGKLKEEVHALLRGHPGVRSFRHEWSPKYGYGATEIFFK